MCEVLVLDPDAASRKLARVVLEADGCRVLQAATPDEARSVLAVVRIDRIVLELDLRGHDGIAFAREIAVAFPGVAIVAMTAANGRSHEAEARAAGCSLYVRKPIDVNTFAAQLHATRPR